MSTVLGIQHGTLNVRVLGLLLSVVVMDVIARTCVSGTCEDGIRQQDLIDQRGACWLCLSWMPGCCSGLIASQRLSSGVAELVVVTGASS